MNRFAVVRKYLQDNPQVSTLNLGDVFGPMARQQEKICMIREFTRSYPAEALEEEIAISLREQNVHLSREMWTKMIRFVDVQNEKGGFASRSQGIGQIGLEILSVLAKLSADEVFVRNVGRLPNQNDHDARSSLIDDYFVAALTQLESQEFDGFALEGDERLINKPPFGNVPFAARIKEFLKMNAIRGTMVDVVNSQIVGVHEPMKLTVESLDATISNMKVYTTSTIGMLKSVSLRDGILICRGRLTSGRGASVLWADTYGLSLHEATHYAVRDDYDDYGFKLPTSDTFPPTMRKDASPSYPDKDLELGRAAEMKLFGGNRKLGEGMQPDWERSDVAAAVDFVQKIEQRNQGPFYLDRAMCNQIGFRERRHPSFSFAGEMVDLLPMLM